jgi:hypothetical protein
VHSLIFKQDSNFWKNFIKWFFKEPNLERYVAFSHQSANYGSSVGQNRYRYCLINGKGLSQNPFETIE